jgi:hypothetical protein
VGDLDVQGVDLITLDDDNRVANIDVLMRPVNSVIALQKAVAPQMEALLKRRAGAEGG